MYCAVTVSFNTVSVAPWVTVTVVESLVQVTVVAGPPVEIQARVNQGLAPLRSEISENAISPDISTSPAVKLVIVISQLCPVGIPCTLSYTVFFLKGKQTQHDMKTEQLTLYT